MYGDIVDLPHSNIRKVTNPYPTLTLTLTLALTLTLTLTLTLALSLTLTRTLTLSLTLHEVEREGLKEDMLEECCKFGKVQRHHATLITRTPSPTLWP